MVTDFLCHVEEDLWLSDKWLLLLIQDRQLLGEEEPKLDKVVGEILALVKR